MMSKIQFIMVCFSIIIIGFSLLFYKKLNLKNGQLVLMMILFAGILGNALTVVLFSTVLNRYQSRVIWVIPLLAILLILHTISYRNSQKINPEY